MWIKNGYKKIAERGKGLLLKIPRIKSLSHRPLEIADFSGYNQPYHPSVLFFEEGFCGYRYWMVQTPCPINGLPYRDRWECPCIYYSEDGIRWFTDPGVNPIDDLNSGEIENGDFFSDPHLVYRKDTHMLECWYRITHMNHNDSLAQHQYPTWIIRKKSKDGLHWGEREVLIDLQNPKSLDVMVRSPAVLWDDNKKTYRMWYVDSLPSLSGRKIMYAESGDGMTWSGKEAIRMDRDIEPWHIDVSLFDGRHHLINYTLSGKQGLHYYDSDDGIRFRYVKELLRPSPLSFNRFFRAGLYRSCSVKAHDGMRVYFSANDGRKTYLGLLAGDDLKNMKVMSIPPERR